MGQGSNAAPRRLAYVWDYDLDEEQFRAILASRKTRGSLDCDWAAVRLLEHAPYPEIRRLLTFRDLIRGWPAWRSQIRSETRRRGFAFLVEWLPQHHEELLLLDAPLA
jgi:hypothetical protein